uniref:Uncharacterized protein LOC111133880 n=1 Tax=Crassostrea virginica TaxID=6565 RepID=A0A8B8EFC4_CRAVI|nr:uncharacterized protein LOC111133880 [Crassostrea virginica]
MKMRMVICFIRVILSVLYFSLLSMSNNFCSDDICCSGYYLYEENGNKTCLECVGAFGNNCSTHCTVGSYGGQCKSKCQCPENQCDRVNGCLKDMKGDGENITAIDERASDTFDFLMNMSIFHWVLGTAWIPLLAFCCTLFYVIRRHQKRNRIRRKTRSSTNRAYISHCLPIEQVGEYQRMRTAPFASIEYVNTTFEANSLGFI